MFLKNDIKRGGPKRKNRIRLSCCTRPDQPVLGVPSLHQFATQAVALWLIIDVRDQRFSLADDRQSSLEGYVTAIKPAQEHASICSACRRTVPVRAAAPVLIKHAGQAEANSAIADRLDGYPQPPDNVKFFRANLDVFMQRFSAAKAARHTQRRALRGIRSHRLQ